MKRCLDILFSLAGLLVLSPLLLLVAVLVKISSPGPVFFRQDRMGRGGANFRIFKFRTMVDLNTISECQVTAGNDPRITVAGKFMRRHKLDELPQLFNVLRGEMSFVGPRPEVRDFAELYPSAFAHILQVRPGITHPATLSFRREEEILAGASDARKFYIDTVLPVKLAAYEAHLGQSLLQDLKTIFETILPGVGQKPLTPAHFAAELDNQKIQAAGSLAPLAVVAQIPVYGQAKPRYAAAVDGDAVAAAGG